MGSYLSRVGPSEKMLPSSDDGNTSSDGASDDVAEVNTSVPSSTATVDASSVANVSVANSTRTITVERNKRKDSSMVSNTTCRLRSAARAVSSSSMDSCSSVEDAFSAFSDAQGTMTQSRLRAWRRKTIAPTMNTAATAAKTMPIASCLVYSSPLILTAAVADEAMKVLSALVASDMAVVVAGCVGVALRSVVEVD